MPKMPKVTKVLEENKAVMNLILPTLDTLVTLGTPNFYYYLYIPN
jgi:hypothetical protein